MTLLGPPPSASLFPSAAPAPQPAASRQAAPVWREVARIWVPGIPRPGGSKTSQVIFRGGQIVMNAKGRPLITTRDAGGEKTAAWKDTVSFYAREQFKFAPLLCELKVGFIFYLPRIGSHYGTGKNKGVLKASAAIFHTVKPDKTKLTRSTEDALTGIIWKDDTQICDGFQTKFYTCEESNWNPGARIVVSILEDAQ
jgi:Holliday junction resolvase RusA-like endonuclease